MTLLLLFLLYSLCNEEAELLPYPEITVTLKAVIEGDYVTLTCDVTLAAPGDTTGLQYTFYINGLTLHNFSTFTKYRILPWQPVHSEDYTCEVRTPSGSVQKRSDALNIQREATFSDPTIRASPSSVTEGDEMTLTCDTTRSPVTATTELHFAFYRNWRIVQIFSTSATYRVTSAKQEDSGRYHCDVTSPSGRLIKRSNGLYIHIATFSAPRIRASPSSVTEGDEMTLTCDTARSPVTATTGLQFTFYSVEKNVQAFSMSATYSFTVLTYRVISATYRVTSAKAEDSGIYSCAVTSPTGKLTKWSSVLYIHIATFSAPTLRSSPLSVTEGDEMTLTCDTKHSPVTATTGLHFAFYRDEKEVQEFNTSATYTVTSAKQEDSGRYRCDVTSPTSRLTKRSNVLYIHIVSFTDPTIRSGSSSVTEGNEMTLTCDTTCSPVTATTGLHFAFYRDEQIVQDFNTSATYRVTSAEEEDSGRYRCDVTFPTGRLTKKSDVLSIHIEKGFPLPMVLGAVMGAVVLIILISVLLVWKCRKNKASRNTTADTKDDTSPSLEENVSCTYLDLRRLPTGDSTPSQVEDVCYSNIGVKHLPKGDRTPSQVEDVCYSNIGVKHLPKAPASKNENSSALYAEVKKKIRSPLSR
ncbi:high affinity immunoglobulin gamma Fc receptor I-like [Pseudophryne corroboree]|uniref:high affinity immunoglobulin gamma Fc receptor I-like n=1 Tax=Pseudophryne corroboree TaxID=495146 RepID=UPI0030813E42